MATLSVRLYRNEAPHINLVRFAGIESVATAAAHLLVSRLVILGLDVECAHNWMSGSKVLVREGQFAHCYTDIDRTVARETKLAFREARRMFRERNPLRSAA